MSTSTDKPTRPATGGDEPGRRRWLTIAAGGFVLLLIVGSLFVVLWPSDEPPAEAPPAPQAQPPGGDGASTAVPTAPPEGVSWELVNGIAVPVSETAGPTQVDGPVHHGFAHTPEGALMAALQIWTRYGFSEGDGWHEVTMRQVMPGPGREVYVEAREKVGAITAEPANGWGQVAGFRFQSYSPQEAAIEVVQEFDDETLQLTSYTVVWDGGDWRMKLQPDGDPGPYTSVVPDLSGFVKFSGV